MKKIIVLLHIAMPFMALSQRVISGKVFNAINHQPLPAASITVKGNNMGTVTFNNGSFKFNLPARSNSVVVSYAGYMNKAIRLDSQVNEYAIGLMPLPDERAITVIGTRNLSRTKVQTAVPVDVIPISTIAREAAQTDLNQLLSYSAPSFQSSRQTVSDGTDHIDPAQLRGLGSDQVLVLVNGKRQHQSALVNVNGTVNRGQVGTDLNAIPVSSIERLEVLRDGAAAQYGSDAIAGVINIVLKKNSNHLTGNISYGENITRYPKDYAVQTTLHTPLKNTSVQDGGTFQAGLNYGINLKDAVL